jgi:hypothetical protein
MRRANRCRNGSPKSSAWAARMAEVRESYLMKIDHPDEPARIWSGVGKLVIPADIVESAPATYLGAAHLLSIPDFQQLINGVAERIEFSVSGINEDTARLALEDAPGVPNCAIYIGRADFNEDWQLIGVEWEATFRADFLSVESQSSAGVRVRTLKLSAGSGDTGRSYAPAAFFTPADQRLRSATDDIFDHVPKMERGTARIFGPRFKD